MVNNEYYKKRILSIKFHFYFIFNLFSFYFPYSRASMILSKSPLRTDSVHLASEPILANLRVSAFLQAARALLFFAAGATPDKSVFFFSGAAGSSIISAFARRGDEDLVDAPEAAGFDVDVEVAAGAAAAVRDGRVRGPALLIIDVVKY